MYFFKLIFAEDGSKTSGLSRAKSHHVHSRSQFVTDNGQITPLVSFSSFRLSNRTFGNPLRSTFRSNRRRFDTHENSQTRSYSNIHQLTVDRPNARGVSKSNGLIRSTSYLQQSTPQTALSNDVIHSSSTTILPTESNNRSSSVASNSNVLLRNCRSASPNINTGGLSPVTPTNLFSVSNFNSSPVNLDQLSQIMR